MNTKIPRIQSPEDIAALVQAWGFLPFFRNPVPGFSIAECTPPHLWFSDTADGPWEWKGPVARRGDCLYGKFFHGKAGFISREWVPDFCNARRDGYDFDARFDDELASRKDKDLYDAVAAAGSILTSALKTACHYGKNGAKGFEPAITRLQMQTYLCIADFDYMTDRRGKTYGWGVARYSTPEALMGYDYVTSAYAVEPARSQEKIMAHLRSLCGVADDKLLLRVLGK